jgi:hypothetical protein
VRRPPRVALLVAGAVVGAWLLIGVARNTYFTPRSQLAAEIKQRQDSLTSRMKSIDRAPQIAADLAGFANRTLGSDAESVDHMLRTRLNHIAQVTGIHRSMVSTGQRHARTTPAEKLFPGRSDAAKAMRERNDFVEVEATISGEGSLAQAIELVDRIEAEPWIKKLAAVRLDPRENGARVDVSVKLTTLYLPGRAPDPQALAAYQYDRSSLDQYAAMIVLNPFRIPPPEPVIEAPPVVVAVSAEPPPPPPFPYGQWALTGVAQNVAGPEVWLRHAATGEARRLGIGEGLHEAVFIAARGDVAEFDQNGNRFLVALGDPMDKRAPVQ